MLKIVALIVARRVFVTLVVTQRCGPTSASGVAAVGVIPLSRTFAGLIGLQTFLALLLISCFTLLSLFKLPLKFLDPLAFCNPFRIFSPRSYGYLCLFRFVLAEILALEPRSRFVTTVLLLFLSLKFGFSFFLFPYSSFFLPFPYPLFFIPSSLFFFDAKPLFFPVSLSLFFPCEILESVFASSRNRIK